MIAAVALLAVACNKNQSAVKKLDGNWNVTSLVVTEDGSSIDFIESGFITSASIMFEGCKLKDDEFCSMTTTTTTDFGSNTESDVYAVTDDGQTLQTKDEEESSEIETIEIVELTKTDCKLKQVDGDTTTEMTLEK